MNIISRNISGSPGMIVLEAFRKRETNKRHIMPKDLPRREGDLKFSIHTCNFICLLFSHDLIGNAYLPQQLQESHLSVVLLQVHFA